MHIPGKNKFCAVRSIEEKNELCWRGDRDMIRT